MKLAKVVHCRKEPFDVLIDRTTKWGNPFVIGRDGDRQDVCAKHRLWLPQQKHLIASLHELAGKACGCHCKPLECHGDVIVELVNTLVTQQEINKCQNL